MDKFALSFRQLAMIGLAALLVISTGCQSLGNLGEPAAGNEVSAASIRGTPAPNFALIDLNGDEVSLSDLLGQPVLLNFWATWWPYCRSERAALQRTYEQHRDQGLVVLSVDIGEKREAVQAYTREKGLTFPILLDEDGAVSKRYRVLGIPASFFIDHQGVIQAQHTGPLNESLIVRYLIHIM